MDIKDLLGWLSPDTTEKYPLPTYGVVFGIICLAFHFNGAEFDHNNIALYSGLVIGIASIISLSFTSLKNKYDNINYLYSNTEFDVHKDLFTKHIKGNKFQYLVISDGFIFKFIAYTPDQGDQIEFQKRQEVFEVLKNSVDICVTGLPKHIGTAISGNVLRFTYDLHPGGAFIFGDCNIPNKAIYLFGYTNLQANVNTCSNDMGIIIDKVRAYYKLLPIPQINDKK